MNLCKKVCTALAFVFIPFLLFAQSIVFSQPHGFYTNTFSLTLTAPAGQQIRYTTNGTEPTAVTGTVYSAPITISTTAVIRVISVSGGTASAVQTSSYIFLNDVIRQPANIAGWPNKSYALGAGTTTAVHDYAMDQSVVNDPAYNADLLAGLKDIPSISLVMDQNSFQTMYDGSIEVPASAEILYANNPSQNEQLQVGVEAHSHLRLKRSLRLTFDDAIGGTGVQSNIFKNAPLNGNSATNQFLKGKVVLRGGNNRSWARNWNADRTEYTRDEWYRNTQIEVSGTGSHGTFVHLYVNGLYWGLYNPAERPDAGFQAKYFGGNYEDWLSFDSDGIRSGDGTRYNYLSGTLVNKDMSVAANYAEMKGYLDINNFIDYLMITWMMGMTDWPQNNFQGGNRNGAAATPNKYFAWDGEWSWDVSNGSNNGAWVHPDFRSNQTGGNSLLPKLWHSLRKNSEFMNLFADRVNKNCFNSGALTDAASIARWNTLNNFISKAIIAESARWGDALNDGVTRTKNNHWLPEVNRVRNLMQGNVQRFINALRAEGYYPTLLAPAFSREGGITTSGTSLTMTNPNSAGSIYYTVNGTDPRQSNGTLSAAAVKYTSAVVITGDYTNVRARVFDGVNWSALHEGIYFYPQLKINEFLASNSEGIVDESGVHEDWIEIYNKSTQPVNIAGMYITDLLSNPTLYQIPSTDASKTTIPPNGYLILWADNQPAEGPLHVNVKLSASGEALGLSIMVDGVPTYLDQLSFGAQSADVSTGSFPDGSATVRTFTTPTPGAPNLPPQLSGIYINEIAVNNTNGLKDGAGEYDSWIEIYNKNPDPVNIGGLYLTNNPANPLMYKLPENAAALTTIPGNGFIILWADNQTSQGALHLGFTLNKPAGEIALVNNDGVSPAMLDQFGYTNQSVNTTSGRYPDGSENVRAFTAPTPAAFNTVPLISGLFINEWLASNDAGNTDEAGEFEDWIEIYNSNAQPVDIGGLFITDNLNNASKWQIPTNRPDLTVIPAGGFKLLYADEQPAQGPLHVNIKLSAGGEQIGLSQIQGGVSTTINAVTFGPQTTNISEGRLPDGGATIQALTQLTPGASNQVLTNTPPVANAGPDKVVILPASSTTLNGSGTDNGSIKGYLWKQIGTSPNVATFSSNTVAAPIVSGLIAGKYTFSLIVTDNQNVQSAVDQVTVTVSSNTPPVANAGPDKVVTLPVSSTTLNGSGTDNGSVKNYSWRQIGSSPNLAVFSNKNVAAPVISGLIEGKYTFNLIVTDNENLRSTVDQVIVTVKASTASPVALFRINSGGPGFTYEGLTWKDDQYFTGGTVYSVATPITGTTNDQLYQSERFGNFGYAIPVPNGKYTLRLHFAEVFFTEAGKRVFSVNIESGQSSITGYDIFTAAGGANKAVIEERSVTVTDGTLNFNLVPGVENAKLSGIEVITTVPTDQKPVANAGPNKVITLPVNSTTLDGSATDDGSIKSYLWRQIQTVPNLATFSSKTVAKPVVSGLVQGTYYFNLIVTDNTGQQSVVDQVTVTVKPNGGRSIETMPGNVITGNMERSADLVLQPWNVQAMPNPTTGYFNLRINGCSASVVTINVFNSMGVQVEKVERRMTAGGLIQIGQNYRPGVYIIQVKQDDKIKNLKLIKQ